MGFTAGLRALGIAALGAASIATLAAPTVAVASTSTTASTAAVRVVRIAEAQRGKAYVFGAEGPWAFDCSGLVVYAYRRAGVANRLGGGHSGYGMLTWARAHHRFSNSNPQLGDVVVYGGGAHVGIYIGNGRIISALNPSQGVRITGVHALTNSVTGYIHTGLNGRGLMVAAKATARVATRSVLTKYYVNLRAGASIASHLVAIVRPDVKLRLIGSTLVAGKRWDHVLYSGRPVWVRADLVRAA